MRDYETISFIRFFRIAGMAALIPFCISLFAIGIINYADDGRIIFSENMAQYKHAVFLALADRPFPMEQKLAVYELSGIEAGNYLRESLQIGWTLPQGIHYLARGYEYASTGHDGRTTVDFIQKLYRLSRIPPSFANAVTNISGQYISTFIESEIALLEQVHQGKAEIPPLEGSELPWFPPYSLLIIGIVCQLAAFCSFLTLVNAYDPWWRQLPWQKVWPWFGMLILLPSALPVMIITGGWKLIGEGASNVIARCKGFSIKRKQGTVTGDEFVRDAYNSIENIKRRISV